MQRRGKRQGLNTKWHRNQRKASCAIKGDFPEEVELKVTLEKGWSLTHGPAGRGLLRRGK